MSKRETPGDAARRARIAKGWSMAQAAVAAGVSIGTVRRVERNEPVRTDSLDRYAKALGLDPRAIYPEGV